MLKLEEQDLKRLVDEIWARISPLLGGGEGEFLPLTGGKLTGDVTFDNGAQLTRSVSGSGMGGFAIEKTGNSPIYLIAPQGVTLSKTKGGDGVTPAPLRGIGDPVNANDGVNKKYADTHTAAAATKLETSQTINGAAFDGTKSINTSYAYNLELPMKTQEQWSIFAKIPDGGQYAFSCLIAAAGNYDYKVEGLYLLEFGKRYTNDIDAKVTCISEEGVWNIQPTLDKFGYFVQDGVTYVGIYNARYRGQTSITVLSTANAYNFRTQFGIFDEYTERPEGWTEIPIQKLTTKEYVDSLAWVPPNAASHNANPRCKYLGDHVTDEQYAAIAAGTFDDMFVGDYWTINGFDWMCSGADYLFNTGDTLFAKHHWLITPRTNLYTAPMNDTNTTVGGYVNSKMYTEGLEQAKEIIHAAFPGHVLKHRVYLTNAVTNGYPSGGMWRDSEVELMNEQMVYGSGVFSPVSNGTAAPANHRVEKSQLPLFALAPEFITNRASWWLRDVITATSFGLVSSYGIADHRNASNSIGVRPYFCIG